MAPRDRISRVTRAEVPTGSNIFSPRKGRQPMGATATLQKPKPTHREVQPVRTCLGCGCYLRSYGNQAFCDPCSKPVLSADDRAEIFRQISAMTDVRARRKAFEAFRAGRGNAMTFTRLDYYLLSLAAASLGAIVLIREHCRPLPLHRRAVVAVKRRVLG